MTCSRLKKFFWAATLTALVVATVTLTACGGETSPTEPAAGTQSAATAQPTGTTGWEKYEGDGAELWLPESFVGGSPSENASAVVEEVAGLGAAFKEATQIVEQNPSMYAIWAVDGESASSGVLTSASVAKQAVASSMTMEAYLDAAESQLPDGWQMPERGVVTLGDAEAGRLVLEPPPLQASGKQVKELLYFIRDGEAMWSITYLAGADEWQERLPVFEQSALTFKTPGAANEPSPASSATATPGVTDEAATVGDTLDLETIEGGVVAVTPKATKRLPPAESYGVPMHPALFGVRITLENGGEGVYKDGVEACATLVDAEGEVHDAVVPPILDKNANPIPGVLSDVKLAPGDKRSGWIYFAIGKATQPSQFRFTPDYGVGTQVGEWQLEM